MCQHFAFSMPKCTLARKKDTTDGCGGCDEYELCKKKITFTRIKHHSSYCVDVFNLSCSFGIKDFCQLDHCWQSSNYFVFFQKSCKISDLLSELLLLASSINFTSVTELILLQNNVRTTLHWERERENPAQKYLLLPWLLSDFELFLCFFLGDLFYVTINFFSPCFSLFSCLPFSETPQGWSWHHRSEWKNIKNTVTIGKHCVTFI